MPWRPSPAARRSHARPFPGVVEQVRRAISSQPDSARLLAVIEGEEELDSGTLDRMFGEELPSGLVFAASE